MNETEAQENVRLRAEMRSIVSQMDSANRAIMSRGASERATFRRLIEVVSQVRVTARMSLRYSGEQIEDVETETGRRIRRVLDG